MRHAGREQAEADQAILFLQPAERGGEFVLVSAQLCDGSLRERMIWPISSPRISAAGISSLWRSPAWVAVSAASIRRKGRYTYSGMMADSNSTTAAI